MKLNWETTSLKSIVAFQRGLTYQKSDEVSTSSNVVLRANNINLTTNKLDLSELKYIRDDIKIPEFKKVSKGSLIICTASGSKSHLGKVALIEDDLDYAFGGFMGKLTPREGVDSRYLLYIFTSDYYKEFIANLSSGMNINNLRFDILGEFSFPLPPLVEQQHIVENLDALSAEIEKLEGIYKKNLSNIEELKQTILQKALFGER